MALDFTAFQAGKSAVPDFALQEMQRRQMALQEGQIAAQQQQAALKAQEMQRQAEQQQAGQKALLEALMNPSAESFARVVAVNPEMASQVKDTWGMMEGERQKADMTAMGSIYAAGKAGRYDLAANLMRERVEADAAAGQADPADQAILDALESGDPVQQRAALGQVGMGIAMIAGPERFSAAYGALDTEDEIAIVDGVAINKRTGEALWQSPYGKVYQGNNDFYVQNPISGIPIAGGGAAPADTATGSAPSSVPDMAGGTFAPVTDAQSVTKSIFGDKAVVTDWKRDPNSALGKKNPKSWHVQSAAAVDLRPIKGMTFDQAVQAYKDRGYAIVEAIDEVKNPSGHATGPHWHIVIGTHKPRSKQEYEKLPKGARWIDPEGNVRVKG